MKNKNQSTEVHNKSGETVQENASNQPSSPPAGYPFVFNFDNYHDYNSEVFSNWTEVMLFEKAISDFDPTLGDDSYPIHLDYFNDIPGIPVSTATSKKFLKKCVLLGIVEGIGYHEADLHEDDLSSGYYRFNYNRLIELLPYLMGKSSDSFQVLLKDKRYQQKLKYFKNMRYITRKLRA